MIFEVSFDLWFGDYYISYYKNQGARSNTYKYNNILKIRAIRENPIMTHSITTHRKEQKVNLCAKADQELDHDLFLPIRIPKHKSAI